MESKALLTGNYSAMPNTAIVRNLQREIATEDRLDRDPVLEIILYRRAVLEEEDKPKTAVALRGCIPEIIACPFGFDIFTEDLLQVTKKLINSGRTCPHNVPA